MLNFNYSNPTRILFGRDEHKKLGQALKKENNLSVTKRLGLLFKMFSAL